MGSFVATVCYFGVVGGRTPWQARARARNVRQNEGPWSRPYSPEYVEGEFSEVGIQDDAYTNPPVTLQLRQVASIP